MVPSYTPGHDLDRGSATADARAVRKTNRLVDLSYTIHQEDAWRSGNAAFVGRTLVLATLPHRDPGDVPVFVRRNGDFELAIQPGPWTGLPYGSYPRLILAWLVTEAVRTKSPRIALGASLTGFMRALGISPSGGDHGTVTRFRDQLERLFSARIATARRTDGEVHFQSAEIASSLDLWWNPEGSAIATPGSVVVLGERFFDDVTRHAVPLDLRVLREVKQSALAIDLYTWLTHRLARMQDSRAPGRPVVLSWQQLHDQFGTAHAEARFFAKDAKRELARLRVVWPELHYETPRGRFVLYPGEPHVPRRYALKRAA